MSGGASCVSLESQRSGLNRRPLDYESSALPLSYAGGLANLQCPGADSNRDALRHHPLKMACLPISPPGQITFISTEPTGLEPATSRVTVECSNQTELRLLLAALAGARRFEVARAARELLLLFANPGARRSAARYARG